MNLALVGLVVLQVRGHRVTVARLMVPLVLTGWAATQFLHAVPTAGSDVALEAVLGLSGATLGGLAALATRIRRDGDGAVATAGVVAAVLWVVGIGARMAFALYVTHGGQAAVARFSTAHHISSGAAWGAGFVLMALAEVGARTGVLYAKTRRTGATIPRRLAPARAATA